MELGPPTHILLQHVLAVASLLDLFKKEKTVCIKGPLEIGFLKVLAVLNYFSVTTPGHRLSFPAQQALWI